MAGSGQGKPGPTGPVDELTDDQFLDLVTRWPPIPLVAMRMVWKREYDPNDEEHLRLKRILDQDPSGYYRDLVQMENLYQKQLTAASARDKRVLDLEKQVEELKVLSVAPPGATDEGEERLLDLIDRLRREHDGE